MSRYRDAPRYSSGDLAYRDSPPAQRWTQDRFVRETEYRTPPSAPVLDRLGYDQYRRPYEDDRFYEHDRYAGPRGEVDRRVWEEDRYYNDPRARPGQMVPYAPERPARPEAPPRPGILRRQSSLDTFDRRRPRPSDDYDPYRRGPVPREMIPVGRPPSPRRYPRHDDRAYDDVQIQDPYYYGDEGFREYREREWVRRRRNSSPSPDRRTVKEEIREEIVEEAPPVEKPYPRRGKTRMPKRLVHTKVLFDLGYPFYEENERTILIEKALGPDNIDEIFVKSKEYFEREVSTTRLIEAPPAPPSVRAPSVHGGTVFEETTTKKVEEIKTVPLSEAPRSVRDWDGLSVRSPSPKSHRSRSRRRSTLRGSSPGGTVIKETIIEKDVVERDISPARTHRTSRSHRTRRSSSAESGTVIERTRIIKEEFDDSNSVHVGPLALVVDRKPGRSDRDIKEEIRQLEAERRALRRERRHDREESTEIVKIERVRERSPSPRGEIILERRGEEVLEVKKDRRVRSRSSAPSPAIIRAMMATLT